MDNDKDNDDIRIPATAVLWIGISIGIGFSNAASDELNIFNALITLILVMGGAIATNIMWQGIESNKAKRDQHSGASDEYSNLLMQLMTEEERQTIRTRLINTVANDGELPTSTEINAGKYQTTSQK